MTRYAICVLAFLALVVRPPGVVAGEPPESGTPAAGEGAVTSGGEAGTPRSGETPPEPTYRGSESAAMPFYNRAEEAYQAGRYAEAAQLLEQAFEAHEHPLLVYDMGQAYRLARDHQHALEAYQRYIQICPRDRLRNAVYVSMADCLLALNRREEANEALRHYLDLEADGEYAAEAQHSVETGQPPSAQGRRDAGTVQDADAVCNEADALWEQEHFQQAAEVFLRGYERLPDVHELLYDAALCYLDGQMWADAARTFSRYVRTPGAEHDAWAFMAESYAEQFNFSDAVQAYERYLELEPQGTYAEQARTFIRDTMPPAEGSPEAETGASPGEAERAAALLTTARERYNADHFRESLESLQQAYQIVPARSTLFNMGRCYLGLHEWENALSHFERVLERGDEGRYAAAHLDAADCLLELNRREEALRHVEQYMARARESDLPNEESDMEWAREFQQRAQGGSSHEGETE
jgi:tetratricopeptide (TPR) repeat protein